MLHHWKCVLFGALPCALTFGIRRFVETSPEMVDGILAPNAHPQWRFVALLTLFASFVCYRPPQTLNSYFNMLQVPQEWQGQMAGHYRNLAGCLCTLSIAYHLSAESEFFLPPQALVPFATLVDIFTAECSRDSFSRRRKVLMMVMTPIHLVTTPLRLSGQIKGTVWPAIMIFPVTGALLNDSVGVHLAESLFMTALVIVDPAQTTNSIRIGAVLMVLFSLVVLMCKIVLFWHLPFVETERDVVSVRSSTCEFKKSGSVAESIGISFATSGATTDMSGDTHEKLDLKRGVARLSTSKPTSNPPQALSPPLSPHHC